MANPVDVASRVDFLPVSSVFRPWDFRASDIDQGPGVADYESFRVMQRQAGATMDVDIGKTGVGPMLGWVRGSTRNAQGVYRVDNVDNSSGVSDLYQSQIAVTVPAANGTNPRVDCVVMRVLDTDHGGASNTLRFEVLQGTAIAGATLDNRNGAPSIPASCELLADILVPAASSSVVTANIRDRRRYPLQGVAPSLLTASFPSGLDQVTFQPHPAVGASYIANGLVATSMDNTQTAVLMFLPRRIVGATRIRWKYAQTGGIAAAGNFVLAIYDASGRLIVQTSPAAFTGTTPSLVPRQETITATTFEAGWYYVMIGVATVTGGSTLAYVGSFATQLSHLLGVSSVVLRAAAGGTTPPTTLLGLADQAAVTAVAQSATVPLISLSVG